MDLELYVKGYLIIIYPVYGVITSVSKLFSVNSVITIYHFSEINQITFNSIDNTRFNKVH